MVKFWHTTGKYGCFSNFSAHPITVNGKSYLTTEHYYQACKIADDAGHEVVRTAATPKAAKNLARCLEMKDGWDEVKYQVMVETLTHKANQYPEIKKLLLETGDQEIIEDSPKDPIWGVGKDGKGTNLLGKAWMQVRDNLKDQNGKISEDGIFSS